MNTFKLRILAADKIFYDGECESLVVPAADGEFGVQANHANMVLAIVPGVIRVKLPDIMEPLVGAVSYGMLRVEDNEVNVLVDTAEHPDEIDENRALAAAERAKEELHIKQNREEYMRAQAEMNRAIARLKVKKANRKY